MEESFKVNQDIWKTSIPNKFIRLRDILYPKTKLYPKEDSKGYQVTTMHIPGWVLKRQSNSYLINNGKFRVISKGIQAMRTTLSDMKMPRDHKWYPCLTISLCHKENSKETPVTWQVICPINRLVRDNTNQKGNWRLEERISQAIQVILTISNLQIISLYLRNSGQNKMAYFLRENSSVKAFILKITSLQRFKKDRVSDRDTNCKSEVHSKEFPTTLVNIVKKRQ